MLGMIELNWLKKPRMQVNPPVLAVRTVLVPMDNRAPDVEAEIRLQMKHHPSYSAAGCVLAGLRNDSTSRSFLECGPSES